jgi:hypothetical protein
MFPVLAGLGAAVIAYAIVGEKTDDGETIPKPTQKPKSKKSSKAHADVESAAAAHARATKERDDHWKAQIRTLKGNHKSALSALSDALKPEAKPEVVPSTPPNESDDDE